MNKMDLLSIMPVEFNKQIDATFDSTALQEFADQLYSRAGSIVLEGVAGYGWHSPLVVRSEYSQAAKRSRTSPTST